MLLLMIIVCLKDIRIFSYKKPLTSRARRLSYRFHDTARNATLLRVFYALRDLPSPCQYCYWFRLLSPYWLSLQLLQKSIGFSIKMPKSTEINHSISLDNFIAELELLHNDLAPYQDYPAVPTGGVYINYKKWTKQIRTYFDDNKLTHYLSKDFFIGDHMDVPFRKSFSLNWPPDPEYRSALKQFRLELSSIIKNQITELKDIKTSLTKNTKPLIIYLEKGGLLWREPKLKYSHGSSEGVKRTRLIRLLAEHDGYVKTEILIRKFSYANLSALSREKGKINSLIKEKLGLIEDLITGKRISGYRINERFQIILN